MNATELSEKLEALLKKCELDEVIVAPTFRTGLPQIADNINGWMVCEILPGSGCDPDEEDPVATGLSRNVADLLALLINNAATTAARLRSMEEALSREERAHEQTVDERDIAQATADRLADLIAQITGVEIGEHRAGLGCPGNDPHLNAIDAAEGFLHARAALSGEGQ